MVLLLSQRNSLIVFLLMHNALIKAHLSISLSSSKTLWNQLKKRKNNSQSNSLNNLRKIILIPIQVTFKRVTNGRLLIFNKDS